MMPGHYVACNTFLGGYLGIIFSWLNTGPVNQPPKIDQSDSFLPTTELALKVYCFKNWLFKLGGTLKIFERGVPFFKSVSDNLL